MAVLLLPQTHHRPGRPAWAGRSCERPWPCADAKGDLGIEFESQPALLFSYMAAQIVTFVEDLGASGELPTPDASHARFIGWVRPATAKARAAR